MAHTVNVNIKMDEDVKKRMERACAEMGLSMSAAFTMFAKKVGREYRIPFEVSADPFYSESNMNYLRRVISDIESRKAVLKEHIIASVKWLDIHENETITLEEMNQELWNKRLKGIIHSRRHLAASPVFKGIPNFKDTRIAMLRAETLHDLFGIIDGVEEPLVRENEKPSEDDIITCG